MVNDHKESGWACLLIDGVPRQAWAHRIDSQPKVIGRDEECGIPLLHATVSRRHAEIWSSDVEIFLRDLGSRNGTKIKGKPITTTSIYPGDSFQVGNISIRVEEIIVVRSTEFLTGEHSTQANEPRATDETVNFFLKRRYGDAKQLKPSQLDVLKLLLRGDKEEAIANELQVSKNTVHSRVKTIYKVFDVNSRSALMAKFIDPHFNDADPLQETI